MEQPLYFQEFSVWQVNFYDNFDNMLDLIVMNFVVCRWARASREFFENLRFSSPNR